MITKKKVKATRKVKEVEWFDDCDICQYAKEMEKKGKPQTEEGLREAFKKAKDKGAVVGGSMFEEESKN